MQAKRESQPVSDTGSRIDIRSVRPKRHIIRFGPEWPDIIVIEGEAADVDVTAEWRDKQGLGSSAIFDCWARPDN